MHTDRYRPALPGRFGRIAFVVTAGALAAAVGACSTSPTLFSHDNARAHVERLAGAIGSRPAGTAPNRQARDYIVGQLRASGFDVRVQEADAERPGLGVTARVANIIATVPGARGDVVALMAHYDSVPDGPGAADDGFGVAVCLEAGRVLARRGSPAWTLAVILTDGEELGLMGAAALLKDPIRPRIRAALNFEAIGSGAPVMLFDTSRSAGALVGAWARRAPRPAGASFMAEIYKVISRGGDRTDLGLLRRAGVTGLDFAVVGDGYTYHTPLDAPRRLDTEALRRAGENTVAMVGALDRQDLADHAPARSYFDLLGIAALAYGERGELAVLGLAVLTGLVAWFHVIGVARRKVRAARIVLTVPWLLDALVLVGGAMVAGAWLLRATRESLHPWYAHPDRLFAWLILVGAAAGWLFVRLGRLLPVRVQGSTEPAVAWTIALPVWLTLAVLAGRFASASAFLVAWPLLAAGAALLAFPVDRPAAMRAATAVVAVVVAVLWLPNVALLLHFVVPELDRSWIVTPVFFYPALLLAVGFVVAPPLLALAGASRPLSTPSAGATRSLVEHGVSGSRHVSWLPGIVLVGLAVVAFVAAWSAPAYTPDRPAHHVLRYLADVASGQASWETGANEPGRLSAAWLPGPSPSHAAGVVGPLRTPYVHHAPAPPPGPPPFHVTGSLMRGSEAVLEVIAVPAAAGWTVAFALPPDVIPLETNIACSLRAGRQVAVFQAVPPEGATFRGRFELSDASKLTSVTVAGIGSGVPGAAWPALPAWLPQQGDVWQARSYYLLPISWRQSSVNAGRTLDDEPKNAEPGTRNPRTRNPEP